MTVSTLPDRVLADLNNLPAMPTLVLDVLRLLDNPEIGGDRVAAAIGRDPVITARVLRLANSAAYMRVRRVATIRDAIMLLGFSTVRGQVLAAALYDVFKVGAVGYALTQEALWQHSVAVGTCARYLAAQGGRNSDAAFEAGLLHDIGKIVLGKSLRSGYAEVLKLVQEGSDFCAAERQVLGCDHAEVGAEAGKRWNLPPDLLLSIEYHHKPLERPEAGLADIVHIADAMALMLGFGIGADNLMHQLHDAVFERVGLDPTVVNELLLTLADQIADAAQPLDDAGK
jgi:putative nucleotidyltransferase with HDIG domain